MKNWFLKSIVLMAALCGILAFFGTKKIEAATEIKADMSWYDDTKTEFTLTTPAQLFGLAELAKTNNFEGKTINLTENGTYVLNGDYLTAFATWKTGTTATNVFPGIGTIYNGAAPFMGIFNGNGATILGMYRSVTSRSGGFFNSIVGAGTVNDLNFDYCYTKSTAQGAAIIAGTICSASNYAWNGTANTNHFSLNNVTTGTNCYVTTSANFTGLINGEIWGAGIKNATANGAVKASNATGGNARGAAGISGGSTSNNIWFCNCTNNATVDSDNWGVAGIFGCWQYATNGTVRFTDCLNTGAITDTTNNSYSVGGIFGGNELGKGYNIQITDCENRGTIKCTRQTEAFAGGIVGRFAPASGGTLTITNCKNTGNVSGYFYVGGIVGRGQSNININGAYVSGTIASTTTGADPFTGGVLGHNSANTTIRNAYVTATVTTARADGAACMGGIVGTFGGTTLTLEQCGFFGTLTNVSATYGQVGLIMGQADGNGPTGTLNFTKCFAISDALAGMKGAGAVGQNNGNYNTNGWPVVLQKTDMYGEGLYPFVQLDNNWKYVANDVPQLVKYSNAAAIVPNDSVLKADYSWFTKVSSHTQQTSWTIEDAADYLGLVGISAAWPSNENIKWGSCTVKLGKDIELNTGDASGWGTSAPANKYLPIGVDAYNSSNAIQLSIDGQNHTISGLYVKTAGMAGMISQMNVGTVKDLTLTNSYIAGTAMRVGAIAGCVSGSGTFDNITVTDSVYVEGALCAGGVVGQGWGCTIKNCGSNANVSGSSSTIGGILGANTSIPVTITDCTFGGIVHSESSQAGGIVGGFTEGDGGTITNCTVSGQVIANTNIAGGIIGYQNGTKLTISGCLVTEYALIQSNCKVVGGIIGQADIAATIEDSQVKGTLRSGFQVGGFVGFTKANLSITNSEFSGKAENLTEYDYWRINYSYMDNGTRISVTYAQWITGSAKDAKAKACDTENGTKQGYVRTVFRDFQRFAGAIGDTNGAITVTLTDIRLSGSVMVRSDENSGNINIGGIIGLAEPNLTLNATRVLVDEEIRGNRQGVGIAVGRIETGVANLNFTDVYCAEDSAVKTIGETETHTNAFDLGDAGTDLVAANAKVTLFPKNASLGGDGYKTFKNLGFIEDDSTWFLAKDSTPLLRKFKGETAPAVFTILVTSGDFNENGGDRKDIGALLSGPGNVSNFNETITFTVGGNLMYYEFLGWYPYNESEKTVDLTKSQIFVNKTESFETLEDFLDNYFTDSAGMYFAAVYQKNSNVQAEITIEARDTGNFPFKYQIIKDGIAGTEITISEGEVTVQVPIGAKIKVTFLSGDADFYGWHNESMRLYTKDKAYELTVFRNDSIIAKAAKTEDVQGALITFISNSDQIISSARYAIDETITFPTNQYSYGMEFAGWTLNGTRYTEEEARNAIQVAMDSGVKAVYLKAAFNYTAIEYRIDIQPVLVTNLDQPQTNTKIGTLIPGTVYKLGAIAKLEAPEKIDGHFFRFYMNENGTILSYEKAFRYRGTGTEEVYAVYADRDVTVAPVLLLTGLNHVAQENGKNTYTAIVNRSVSSGYTVMDQGILAFIVTGQENPDPADTAMKAMANTYLTLVNVGFETPQGTALLQYKSTNLSANNSTTLNLKNVPGDSVVYMKGYMTYKNETSDEITTVYTKLGQAYLDNLTIQ